ncbi:MAG: chromosome segregation protein SMC [Bdellovibrionales bacterium RIFOXYD12_FULL_39_22]|nr:MAG: chromosome segregation protein SMC [Bdellovibrionales bacterium RIFOXYB1_FULL_39_21]OFZ41906.1 MAG: chromosome segregation protein SMC [Bdellovibrionales bacterium RIFOXYC12_FULL_39_17]OFZ50622.1 MAG: chromosome segregation protein SMC [Bdellovibrionales bacterium RIFOXYC1_FULL_39_130]OFZ77845.1 MAG: chromosome segregation protein SMC [Bdellovibrionales bacterium RIFOXYD1_FULL_39_84]OFZ93719.1 MAG: chromosome segregation protein SMC [Bdellovibrionales bacterium RIFOXYD12_FULL_39_22]HLE
MKLQRLIIHGFKSFKDKTVITFDRGITGIVGPNGCGKSNIVDALFWVMGEQSAKHLRGNTMKDVIFSGSSKYSPGVWAEVSLILENDEGKHIHIGESVCNPSEIQLTRKLYRNGESEYRINNVICRLKDIQEVFMDTGAGAKSYSIIAQGEIDRLVQAKPEERRVMIEEVAGITKFKMRKRESLRKIEQAQSNLLRLVDIQTEVEKNLKSLERQAEKAEQARALKIKIEHNELIVNSHREMDLLKDIRDGQNIIREKKANFENWQTQKSTIELGLEEERIRKQAQIGQIELLQTQYNEISRKLAASEERLNSLDRSRKDKEQTLARTKTEIVELGEEIVTRSARLSELEAEQSGLNDLKGQDDDFSDLESRVSHLKLMLEEKEEELLSLQRQLNSQKSSKDDLERKLFQNTTRQKELSAGLQDITTEIEALEKQYSGVSGQISEERSEVINSETRFLQTQEDEQKLKKNLEQLSEEYKQTDSIFRQKNTELIKTESKHASLKELADSLAGARDGAVEFLKTEDGKRYTLLGNLVKCDDRFTRPVQALLAGLLESIVSGETDHKNLLSWIGDNKGCALDFLELDSKSHISDDETVERLKLNGLVKVSKLSEVVVLPEGYDFLRTLFANHFIVEECSINALATISGQIKFKKIVSLEGDFLIENLNGSKIVSVLGDANDQSIVARNNRIAELEKERAQLQLRCDELAQKEGEQKSVLEQRRLDYDNLRTALANAKAEFISKKAALDSKLSAFETGRVRLEILRNRKGEVSKDRLQLMEDEERLATNLAQAKQTIESFQSQHDEIADTVAETRSSYEENRSELLEKQVELKSLDSRIASVTRQLDDLHNQLSRNNLKLENSKGLVTLLEEELVAISAETHKLREENQATANDLLGRDNQLNGLKDELTHLLNAMQERENEVRRLARDISKTEKDLVEYEIKLQQYIAEEGQVVRDTFEKYHVDLRQVVGAFLGFISTDYETLVNIASIYFQETENGPQAIEVVPYEFNRRYGQELKDCEQKFKRYRSEYALLGEINWQAIEDFERQKKRASFLREQEGELKKSLADLELAITQIDHKSKERFSIAFNEVNDRFQKVFPIIFGGGRAELKIVGLLDDPECGVDIIAQPPGKKMQNINLMSGGEKAMTAVSLIFSIFLVKPSPFCLLDEVDAPLDDANVGRFNELLREMSKESQFILITHNKKTMEMNDVLYGVTMQEAGVSKAVSVQLH